MTAPTGPSHVPAPGPALRARLRDADALATRTQALLASHVPLTLLLDLADPGGPHSADLMWNEAGAADWLPRA